MAKKKEIKTAMPAAMKEFRSEMFGELTVINFDEAPTEPWFILNEVCSILGYANPSDTKSKHLRKKDCLSIRYSDFEGSSNSLLALSISKLWSNNDFMDKTIINECGLFRLIMRSKKKEAEAFQDWVCGDVLPMIRRTGAYLSNDVMDLMTYGTAEERAAFLDSYGEMKLQLINLSKKVEVLTEGMQNRDLTILSLNKKIDEYLPMVQKYKEVISTAGLYNITQIAKDTNIRLTAQALHKILEEERVIFKKGRYWYLYDEYAKKGFVKIDAIEGSGTYRANLWTEEGRMFIIDLISQRINRARNIQLQVI